MSTRRVKTPPPEDLLTLSASLRTRSAKMVSRERLDRVLEAASFDEAARIVAESGYGDVSRLDTFGVEDALSSRRAEIYAEIAKTAAAAPVLDIFRAKYDYHNVKVLVKSMGANINASRILSSSGRIPAEVLTEAFITGERGALPALVRTAISEGVGTLSRSSNPQLADVGVDKRYFQDITALAAASGSELTADYVRLLIDGANLRTYVRSVRTKRPAEFIGRSLFDGGNTAPADIMAMSETGESIAKIFRSPELLPAAEIAADVMNGGTQTEFEREIDNAAYRLTRNTLYIPFGHEAVLEYLLALDWEITALRMALTGLLAGIEPSILRERIRDGNV